MKFYRTIQIIIFLSANLLAAENYSSISFFKIYNQNSTWWQTNNNNGFEIEKAFLKGSINLNKNSIYLKSDFYYSISENTFHFNTASLNYDLNKSVNVKLGRFERQFSTYLDDKLSSGSMLESTNAQKIPKIGIYYNYKPKKRTKLNFSFGLAHGVFDKNSFYKSAPYLHEKFIYLIRKNKNSEFGIGLVHEAMWGGNILIGEHPGKQPVGFKNFLKVFISADGPLREGEVHANALGNHLGIWDFYYIQKERENRFKFYYQHIFEDTSSLRFANKSDGLWGFQYDNLNYKTGILLEYLNTTNCCIDPPYQSDNYYYNYQYKSGWRYKNNIIGNPFVNPENSIYVDLIKLMHLGFYFHKDKMNFKLLTSRKINMNDYQKSMFIIKRKMSENIIMDFLIFKDKKVTNYGFGVNYQF